MTGKPGRPKKNDKKKRLNTWIKFDTYAYLSEKFPHLDSFGDAIDALMEYHRNNLRKNIDSRSH